MGYEKAILPNDQGTRVDGEGKPLEAEKRAIIVYSHSMGQYAELCADSHIDGIAKAFGLDVEDASAIFLAPNDRRHAHHDNGDCIRKYAQEKTRDASEMRLRMGRAFVIGEDMYRV